MDLRKGYLRGRRSFLSYVQYKIDKMQLNEGKKISFEVVKGQPEASYGCLEFTKCTEVY